MVAILSNLVGFIISLAVGGLSLFLAAQLIHDDARSIEHAAWTAVIGAIAWGLFAWIPAIGGFIALLAWITVIALRYPGGLLRAAFMGVIAWLVAVVILAVLSFANVGVGTVFGVPFI